MRDSGLFRFDLSLSKHDSAVFIDNLNWKCGRGRSESSSLYVVVHRSAEVWTHVYRVTAGARAGSEIVYLERVLEGARVQEAMKWISDTIERALIPHSGGTTRPAILDPR